MTQLSEMRERVLTDLNHSLFIINRDLDNLKKLAYYCQNTPDSIVLVFEYWQELRNLQLVLEKTKNEFRDKTYDIIDKLKSTN